MAIKRNFAHSLLFHPLHVQVWSNSRMFGFSLKYVLLSRHACQVSPVKASAEQSVVKLFAVLPKNNLTHPELFSMYREMILHPGFVRESNAQSCVACRGSTLARARVKAKAAKPAATIINDLERAID